MPPLIDVLFLLACVGGFIWLTLWWTISSGEKDEARKREQELSEFHEKWRAAMLANFSADDPHTFTLEIIKAYPQPASQDELEWFAAICIEVFIQLKPDPPSRPSNLTLERVADAGRDWRYFLSNFAEEVRKQYKPPAKSTDDYFLMLTKQLDPEPIMDRIYLGLHHMSLMFGTEPAFERMIPNKKELTNSPFNRIKDFPGYIPIDASLRTQHIHLCAGTGSGKTTLISSLIWNDLFDVAKGECSVVLMSGDRDVIKKFDALGRFATDLKGKVILIDCEEVEHPPAFNLFDLGDTDGLSPAEREAIYNSTLSMLRYVFTALIGSELTPRMNTMMSFAIQLMLATPGATLDDLIDLMQDGGKAKFPKIATLDPDARRFFMEKFDDPKGGFRETKSYVTDRLYAIKGIKAISRMFSAKETKLNFYEEFGKGRFIIINASQQHLSAEGVEIFGRFQLALIRVAMEKRYLLPERQRKKVWLYLDEAQNIVARDTTLPVMLDEFRKLGMGVCISHQRLGQMTPPVLSALYGSTSIKLAANVQDAEAAALARNMQTTPQMLAHPPQHHFVVFARGITSEAALYKAPVVDLSDRLSAEEERELREDMRRRYSIAEEPKPRTRRNEEEDTRW